MLLGAKPEGNICWEDSSMGPCCHDLASVQPRLSRQIWSATGPSIKACWSKNMIPSLFVVCFYVVCSRMGNIWSGVTPTDTNLTFQLFWKCFSWQGEFILRRCSYYSGLDPWNRICWVVKPHPENNIPPTLQMPSLCSWVLTVARVTLVSLLNKTAL